MSLSLTRLLRYSFVGVSTFALDLALLFLFVDVFSVQMVFAAGVAFLIAVSANYFLSRRYVFKGTLRDIKSGYSNFVFIALIGLLIVTLGMYFMVTFLSWNYLSARIVVAFVTGFWNYIMNLYVNFKVVGRH